MKSRLQTLLDELASSTTPGRADKEKAYLKSALIHLGVAVPTVRKIAKRAAKGLCLDEALSLVEALWSEPVHERRAAAVEVLDVHKRALGLADMVLLERLLREARTWALVDPLAISVVGHVVASDADAGATLDRWITDEDFWIRRAAMLALLRPIRKGDGDWARFTRYADATLDETEFFIRKAIGWILREAGKRRPERVLAFIAPRTHRASGVTMREAVKPLDPDARVALMAAYKAKRPASTAQ